MATDSVVKQHTPKINLRHRFITSLPSIQFVFVTDYVLCRSDGTPTELCPARYTVNE
jgi:hypothetical protein